MAKSAKNGKSFDPSRQEEDELQGPDTTKCVTDCLQGIFPPLCLLQNLAGELAMSRDEDLRVKCTSMGALVVWVQLPCKQVEEMGETARVGHPVDELSSSLLSSISWGWGSGGAMGLRRGGGLLGSVPGARQLS